MIRTSLRRFYSTPRKPKPKTFPLARPIERRPEPTPKTLPKEVEPRKPHYTIGEIARATLAPYSINSQQWRRDLSRKKSTEEVAKIPTEDTGHGEFTSVFELSRRCVFYGIGIFVFGHLFTTHVCDLKATLGASMLPTLYYEGDWVLVNKLYRRGKGVQVGDIVEAKDPLRADGRVLKRIIGMPGDFVIAHTVETDGMMLQVCINSIPVVG